MTRLSGPSAQALALRTYFSLRWGLAGAAVLLPIVLFVLERLISTAPMPLSISGYYHTETRNVFEGTLVVMAVFLFLYKGFSRPENVLLNVAGVAVAGIAIFPTGRDRGATDASTVFTWAPAHEVCALIAFGSIGYVAIRLGGDTLDLIHDAARRARFQRCYRWLGIAMIVLPLGTVALSLVGVGHLIWTETAALWVFGGYWLVKTWEFKTSEPETQALSASLPGPRPQASSANRVSAGAPS